MKKSMIFPVLILSLVLFTAFTVIISGCGNATGGGSSGGGARITSASRFYISDVSNKMVIVLQVSSETVGTVETQSFLRVSTIELTGASTPQWMVVRPDGTKLYVSDPGSNKVFVINTGTNTVEATVTVCSNPKGMDFNPNGSKLFIVCSGDNDISIIDTATNGFTHSGLVLMSNASNLAYSSSGNAVYIADYGNNQIIKASAETDGIVTDTITVPYPYGIVMGSGSNAFVASDFSPSAPELFMINLANKTIVQSWEASGTSKTFRGIAITSDKKKLFAASCDYSYIDYLNVQTLPSSLVPSNYLSGPAGGTSSVGGPEQIVVYPDGRYLAVLSVHNSTHEVVVVDTVKHERIGELALPSSTYFGIAYKL